MRAIVIQQPGGPEQLVIAERPRPVPRPGEVLIAVRAFGLNQAELYFRQGLWGAVPEITGIECVGEVVADASGRFESGQKVAALVGGMARRFNGSYAEYTCVPASNVVALRSELPWEQLAALPESYATAWSCLHGNLGLQAGQVLLVRGATSALGQAALNIAAELGAEVIATTRRPERRTLLQSLGAREALVDGPELARHVRERHPRGIDAVLDIVGARTMMDSLQMLRRGGRLCVAGFLGGGGPVDGFEPVFQLPSGRHLSVFASALVLGGEEFPLSEVPLQDMAERVADGRYRARPAAVFRFEQIREAHELLACGEALGKIVVLV